MRQHARGNYKSDQALLSIFHLVRCGHNPYADRQVLDRLQTKEVLRATLHAILFHRLFGTVRPRTFEVPICPQALKTSQ